MGFFKKLFTKKEDIKVEDIESENMEQEDKTVIRENICSACELEIHGEQKSVKVAGKRYHVKPCWRTIQKMAKEQAFR